MDLFKKKRNVDMKTLASNPLMYYGKIALLALGAFAAGRASTRNDPENMSEKIDNMI
ncbi:MAG: hypothetical protein ACOCVB_02985 [Bacillota bacterium]